MRLCSSEITLQNYLNKITMTREEIISRINPRIAEEFELEESVITPDAVIYDTLDLDSISLIDLVGIVQALFRIKLEKNELEQIKTFNDLYDYIESHQ